MTTWPASLIRMLLVPTDTAITPQISISGRVAWQGRAAGLRQPPGPQISRREGRDGNVPRPRQHPSGPGEQSEGPGGRGGASRDLRWQAWQWALANRAGDGSLPSGREIARQHGRHERWGRLVKRSGAAGDLAHGSELGGSGELGLRLVGQRVPPATAG